MEKRTEYYVTFDLDGNSFFTEAVFNLESLKQLKDFHVVQGHENVSAHKRVIEETRVEC